MMGTAQFCSIHLGLRSRHIQLVLWLVEKDSDLVHLEGRETITPLHYVADHEQGNLDPLARTDQKLKMASKVGEIQGLYSIIKEDQYILERIDQLPFADTPLHIAASKGHTQFALEIMRLKPLLAKKLIQDGFSPMHLALQNQSFQTALRLADVNEQLVCLKGRWVKLLYILQ
ncbi:hypothetical protein GH714_010722 [Hevea brasiliensis]|uniref:Uncharacterized protein n=1 Tax=Hevea brasiliensis TaxID=3981 RepID=A0A6A6N074_HEVBR|nr:hypothetical protein GH714_010722 [Hevea brasiliensis]